MNEFNRLYFFKKTTNNFLIQIKKNNNKYIIFDSSGKPEQQKIKFNNKNNYIKDIVRVVFFGYKVFNQEICEDSKVEFFPVQDGFVQIPYVIIKNLSKDVLPIQISTQSNVFPIIIHYISNRFELLNNYKKDIHFDFIVLYKYSETSMKELCFIYLHLKETEILILEDKLLNVKSNKTSKLDTIEVDGNHLHFLKQLIRQGELNFLKKYLSSKILSINKVNTIQLYLFNLKEQELTFSITYRKFLDESIRLFNLYKCFLFDSPNDVKSKIFEFDIIKENLFPLLNNVLFYRIKNSENKKEKIFFWHLKTSLEKETI